LGLEEPDTVVASPGKRLEEDEKHRVKPVVHGKTVAKKKRRKSCLVNSPTFWTPSGRMQEPTARNRRPKSAPLVTKPHNPKVGFPAKMDGL
jgi:hypothetical protein